MKTLVVGASGATGKHVVEQLLKRKQEVKVIVRSPEKLPESWKNNPLLTILHASVSEIPENEMSSIVKDCDVVISCLGHNLSFQGIYGQPRKLVTDTVSSICKVILKNSSNHQTKFILMNTSGNQNRDLKEPISFAQKVLVGFIRLLLPPHVDNEMAADYLRTQIDPSNQSIEWVAVRPDGLIDEDQVTEYNVYPSPIRSAIFDPGKTSRINVGHFMAELATKSDLWNQWKGQMPVIYNSSND